MFSRYFLCFFLFHAACQPLFAKPLRNRILPDPYYPQQPVGELRLNYYYDRSGKWVKFSDWIPFRQRKYIPRHLEDFYELYGLPHAYQTNEIKENIYFLVQALTHRFRHPKQALCKIETQAEYHKYRLLLFMHINKLIMRMFLRLGSLYDQRTLRYHDLDVVDDLERSFMIARTYYRQAIPYWQQSLHYANQADQYRFTLDLPAIESERFEMVQGQLNYTRIIERHLYKIEAKIQAATQFLENEKRPRPVKSLIQKDIENMYDKNFTPAPLAPPKLSN